MANAAQQNELIRQRLRIHGFRFCDDGHNAQPIPYAELPPFWKELSLHAVESSSCDHESQAIENTLSPNPESFWSSTGHDEEKAEEHLTYRLKEPCNTVCLVSIEVYRARYQIGFPIYPAKAVRFSVGMDPRRLWPVPKVHAMLPSHYSQQFELPPEAPPAHYIRIHLLGKLQRQLEDMRYYHAISRVRVWGFAFPSRAVVDFHRQTMLPLRHIPASLACPGLPWVSLAASNTISRKQLVSNSLPVDSDRMDGGSAETGRRQTPEFIWHGPPPEKGEADMMEEDQTD